MVMPWFIYMPLIMGYNSKDEIRGIMCIYLELNLKKWQIALSKTLRIQRTRHADNNKSCLHYCIVLE